MAVVGELMVPLVKSEEASTAQEVASPHERAMAMTIDKASHERAMVRIEKATEAKAVLLVQKKARTEASPEALMRMIKWTEEAMAHLQPNLIMVVMEM